MDEVKKGRRRLERLEIKGDPYDFIAKYNMNTSKAATLKFLYEMRLARTSQIQRHLGISYRATQRLLSELYVANFVFRKFSRVDRGSAEGIYFLDTMGAFYLAQANSMARKELLWSQRDNAVAPERTDHALSITEIRLALEEAGKSTGAIELIKFHGEKRSGRRRFSVLDGDQEISMDAEIELILNIQGKKYLETVFLEFDLGFEDIRQIREKIMRYENFYCSKEFQEQYQTQPEVVIICTNEIAMRRFSKVILELSAVQNRYFIGLLDELLHDPLKVKLSTSDGKIRTGIVDLSQ